MQLVCIKCGEEATITVDIEDAETCHCPECDGEFTVSEVEAVLEAWAAVLPWLKSHPARRVEPATLSVVSAN